VAFEIPPHGCKAIRLRLLKTDEAREGIKCLAKAISDFDLVFKQRREEADDFYADFNTRFGTTDVASGAAAGVSRG
jgi:hypothetical protein